MTNPTDRPVRIEIRISGRPGSNGVETRILEAPASALADEKGLMARAAAAFPEFTTADWDTVFPADLID
jgi:hypothetical protein